MKFDCGETWSEKFERITNWHEWYAWHPVRVGYRDCRWLEKVQRKVDYTYAGKVWKYKAMEAE